MKKKLILLLAAVMAVATLAGCGDEEQTEQTGSTEVSGETDATGTQESYSTEVISPFGDDVKVLTMDEVKLEDYVTVGEYKGLELTFAAKGSYTQEDVDVLLWNAYVGYVTDEVGAIKERAAENGDWINLDYVGTLKGEAFEGGTAEDTQLELGSGSFIDGFEEGLVGVMPGETVELNLKFPEVYTQNTALAGQEVVFTVTVNYIYPKDETEMVDEVVASMEVPEYTTVKELKQYCEWYLEYEVESEYKSAWQNAAMEALIELAQVSEVPEGLHKKYYEAMYESMKTQSEEYEVNLNEFCTLMYGVDAATYITEVSGESASQAMLIYYIASQENLLIEDAELDVLIKEFAEENYITEDVVREDYTEEDLREYFLFEKVLWFIVENGVITETTE